MKNIVFFAIVLLCSCSNNSHITENPKALLWKDISNEIIISCDSIKITNLHTAAYLMYSNAVINGWNDIKTNTYFQNCIEIISSNSYGLDYEWDAFQDGTINSIETNYTIRMTDHVGYPFIEGYKNGFIDESYLIKIFEKLNNVPEADTLGNGVCIAYSDSPFDQIGCVHNVNISVAYFISELLDLNMIEPTYLNLVDSIIHRELTSYIPSVNNYLYWDGSDRLTDHNHLCFQAWCMSKLDNFKSKEISMNLINEMILNREKTISSLIGYLRILTINSQLEDSLYNDLSNIVNNTDSLYTQSESYNFENPRVKAQLALWSSLYYKQIRFLEN